MSFFATPTPVLARRLFLGRSGLVLSGPAVALLAGNHTLAAAAGAADPKDVQILNTALGAELEAIAAYQVGAGVVPIRKEGKLPGATIATGSRAVMPNPSAAAYAAGA